MKKLYKMKNQFITLSLLCLASVGMSQKIGPILIAEHTISKVEVDFGDTDIETNKVDSFYVKAPSTNTRDISVKVVFDEDRTLGCWDSQADQFGYNHITNGIFEVSLNGEVLHTERERRSFPVPEESKGNKTMLLSPGDSVFVVINISPSNHFSTEIEDGGHPEYDCREIMNPISSLGEQFDEVTIQNLTDGSVAQQIALKFNGVEDAEETDPNGLFSSNTPERLTIFPNPATSLINTEDGQLEILDLTGNPVLSTSSNGQVDVSSLESGVYLVTQNGKKAKLVIE